MSKQKELTQTSGSSCEDRVSGNDRKPEYGTTAAAEFLALKAAQREPSDDVKTWELKSRGSHQRRWVL